MDSHRNINFEDDIPVEEMKDLDLHRNVNFEDNIPVKEMKDLDLNKCTEVNPVVSTSENASTSRIPQISPTNTLQRFENHVFNFSLQAGRESNNDFLASKISRFNFENHLLSFKYAGSPIHPFHITAGGRRVRSSSIFRPRQSLSRTHSEKVKQLCEMKKLRQLERSLMLEKEEWEVKVKQTRIKLEHLKQSC